MRHMFLLTAFTLFVACQLGAQGKGHDKGPTPGSAHSNAPAGTPAASRDRDKGLDRAEDVGKGKKRGLAKKHKHKSGPRDHEKTGKP